MRISIILFQVNICRAETIVSSMKTSLRLIVGVSMTLPKCIFRISLPSLFYKASSTRMRRPYTIQFTKYVHVEPYISYGYCAGVNEYSLIEDVVSHFFDTNLDWIEIETTKGWFFRLVSTMRTCTTIEMVKHALDSHEAWLFDVDHFMCISSSLVYILSI